MNRERAWDVLIMDIGHLLGGGMPKGEESGDQDLDRRSSEVFDRRSVDPRAVARFERRSRRPVLKPAKSPRDAGAFGGEREWKDSNLQPPVS